MRYGRALPLLIALWGVAFGCAGLRGPWRGGVGAVLGYTEDTHALRLAEVPATGAAARAGLHVGDVVLAIDGELVTTMTLTQIVSRLRGEVGTRVVLRVRRGLNAVDVPVERAAYRGSQL